MAGSKLAETQDGLLWLKSAVKTIESNWAKKSQYGLWSSWAWPILTRSQTGPINQYGSERYNSPLMNTVTHFIIICVTLHVYTENCQSMQ